MPHLLKATFDEDFETALRSSKRTLLANLTCLCPKEGTDGDGLFGETLLRFQETSTMDGRRCEGGACSAACSRVVYEGLASREECDELRQRADALLAYSDAMQQESPSRNEEDEAVTNLDLSEAAESGDVRFALLLLRLIERLRRLTAHEYGLQPASTLVPASAFIARIVGREGEPTEGGGAPAKTEDEAAETAGVGVAHADESSYPNYHYSAVLHLHSSGDGFSGGDLVFSDVGDEGRIATRLAPLEGRAVVFSSGWENVHYVEGVEEGGVRFALPVFFETAEEAPPDLDIGMAIARELCDGWGS